MNRPQTIVLQKSKFFLNPASFFGLISTMKFTLWLTKLNSYEREKHKKLVNNFKFRKSKGEKNLIIRNGRVVVSAPQSRQRQSHTSKQQLKRHLTLWNLPDKDLNANPVRVVNINFQSILHKWLNYLIKYLTTHKPSIFISTETCLSSDIHNNEIIPEKLMEPYNLFWLVVALHCVYVILFLFV